DPNERRHDGTALHHAMHLPLVRELLLAGANVNARADDGSTPLLTWSLTGSFELLECLIKAGADVNIMSEGDLSPMLRVWERRSPEIAVMDMYIRAGGDVNQTDSGGRTLLDNFTEQFDKIERERARDQLRAKYFEDYVEERRTLIEFIVAKGAIRQAKP